MYWLIKSVRVPYARNRLSPDIPLLVAGLLLVAACETGSRQSPDIGMKWTVSPDPPQTGKTTLNFELTDSSGSPVRASGLRLEANMTHPGMQPVFSNVSETTSGRYESSFEFTMAGDWYILITGELPDGRSFQRQIDLTVVRTPQ